MDNRELTRAERAKIRRLVVCECANYDYIDGCIPLACDCYMLGKWWTGSYCLYFQNAVLPLDPVLMASLLDCFTSVMDMKSCPICGNPFPKNGRQTYCSNQCREQAQRAAGARRGRKYRRKKRSRVTD